MNDRVPREAEPRSEPEQDDEAVFRQFAEHIPTLAWIANPDGYITWYNRGWYDYSGTTPEQMKGWGWQSVHDPEILPTVMVKWQAAIATGTDFEMVFPLRGADGVFRPFLTRIKPYRDVDGTIMRWFGIRPRPQPSWRGQRRRRLRLARGRLFHKIPPALASA